MRITKVTTKTGDGGKTSLGNGQRVHKNHPIINTLGELDYLNSIIGWAEVESKNESFSSELKNIQQDIFNISGICPCQIVMSHCLKKNVSFI